MAVSALVRMRVCISVCSCATACARVSARAHSCVCACVCVRAVRVWYVLDEHIIMMQLTFEGVYRKIQSLVVHSPIKDHVMDGTIIECHPLQVRKGACLSSEGAREIGRGRERQHTYKKACMHACIHLCVFMCVGGCFRLCVRGHGHGRGCALARANVCVCARACECACVCKA